MFKSMLKKMSSELSLNSKGDDAFKNDFQNARKRNLHLWMRWRSDLNDQLATSVFTGRHSVQVEPLDRYLHKIDHPSENPKTLLQYSASVDNISSLGIKRFLHYGIPRAKTLKRRPTSTTSYRQSDYDNLSNEYFDDPLLENGDENLNVISEVCEIEEPLYSNENVNTLRDANKNNRIIQSSKNTASFQDINERVNGRAIPYYEPDPDYESPFFSSQHSPRRSNSPGSSNFDNITSPGTSFAGNVSSSSESEPEECPYLVRQRQLAMLAEKAEQEKNNNKNKKKGSNKNIERTISRTYSTLNALDPVYVKSSDVKKNKARSKKSKKKDKKDTLNSTGGSWKSFDSTINSKSTDRSSTRAPLTGLFRKTSEVLAKFQSHSSRGYQSQNTLKNDDNNEEDGNDATLTRKESNYEKIKNETLTKNSNKKDVNVKTQEAKPKKESLYARITRSRRVKHQTVLNGNKDENKNNIFIKGSHDRIGIRGTFIGLRPNSRDDIIYESNEDNINSYSNSHLNRENNDTGFDTGHYGSATRHFPAYDHRDSNLYETTDNNKSIRSRHLSGGRRSSIQKRSPFGSEYAKADDVLRRRSQLSSNFYGGSVDVYATSGLVEQIEFTHEPRRLGVYRNPGSIIYGSHTMLRTQNYGNDNWGYLN